MESNHSKKIGRRTHITLGHLHLFYETHFQRRRHSRACQGIFPGRNASALYAALAIKAVITRLFIKCKIMAFYGLPNYGKSSKPGLKHKIRVWNTRRGPNLIVLGDAEALR